MPNSLMGRPWHSTLFHHSICHHKIFWKGCSQVTNQLMVLTLYLQLGSLVLLLRCMCSIDLVVFLYISFKLNVLLFLLVLIFTLEFSTIYSPQLYLFIFAIRESLVFSSRHMHSIKYVFFPIHFFKIKCSVISPCFTICTSIFEKWRRETWTGGGRRVNEKGEGRETPEMGW